MLTIKDIKYKAEKKFKKKQLYNNIYGFQIQPNTKFLKGISNKEIDKLQIMFGFDFPWDYRKMLLIFTNLDSPMISIEPEDNSNIKYSEDNFFYNYPEDFEKSLWLFDSIIEFKMEVEFALTEAGFDVSKIVGYIPVHSHRAIVVFKDKYLSPVISIGIYDIIVLSNNLYEYLTIELLKY
ncbi:MAG: hypothetical protein EOO44_09725 [Flavobacterium sp.]|nr:MAG: hypothetical protein EOO44_09725 [Flavobacterium sp.]